MTGEFPAQRASNAENVSIWWRHHVNAPQINITTSHNRTVVMARLLFHWQILIRVTKTMGQTAEIKTILKEQKPYQFVYVHYGCDKSENVRAFASWQQTHSTDGTGLHYRLCTILCISLSNHPSRVFWQWLFMDCLQPGAIIECVWTITMDGHESWQKIRKISYKLCFTESIYCNRAYICRLSYDERLVLFI